MTQLELNKWTQEHTATERDMIESIVDRLQVSFGGNPIYNEDWLEMYHAAILVVENR